MIRRAADAVRPFFLAVLLAAFAPGAGSALAQTQQEQFTPEVEDPANFPEGEGRDDAFYTCGACHAFKLVARQGFSRERWEETIDLMINTHGMAKLEPKDRKVIVDYLSAAFPVRTSPRGFQNPFLNQ